MLKVLEETRDQSRQPAKYPTKQILQFSLRGYMTQTPANDYVFYLSRTSYKRTRLLAWLLMLGSLAIASASAILAVRLWPTYIHTFTPYLKWQDALLATLWYISLILLGGSVMVVRFLSALRAGFHRGMFILKGDSTLIVRDLSPKNLSSIYWAVGTALSCFIAALVGLIPAILIGWTLHLPHPALVVICTAAAIVLSLAGLAVTLVASSFVLICWVGCISFCRKMGAPQTYHLRDQATLRLDGFVLSITHPDQQEAVFDLNLLDMEDQRHLLYLLHKCWLDAERPWNPRLGEDIEVVLGETDRFTMLV
jgi:hypothetical protein